MKFQISDIKLKLQSNYSKVFGRFDSKDYEEVNIKLKLTYIFVTHNL